MLITKDDIASIRLVDGKPIKLSSTERQAIADEQNMWAIEAIKTKATEKRESLIQQRIDRIARDRAVTELKSEGIIS